MKKSSRSYEKPGAPKNSQSLLGNRLGLGTAIFLLAHFADPSGPLEQLKRMHSYVKRFRERISREQDQFPPHYDEFAAITFELDRLFQVNVIALAVENNTTEKASQKQKVHALLSRLPTKIVVMTNWRAKVSSYDIAHVTHSRPIDKEHGTRTLVVYGWGDLLFQGDNQEEVLTKLVNTVEGAQGT